MPGSNLFTANPQATVSITCAVTTANVNMNPLSAKAVRVKNSDTTNIAYVNFGGSTVTATVPSGATGGSVPIGPGETAGFSLGAGQTYAAAICVAGTPILYFTPGDGL